VRAGRQISVRIDAIRNEGAYNDGYVDNVSLVLANNGPPEFHKTVGVSSSAAGCIRRPGSKQDVHLTASVDPAGITIDAEHGALELSSVPAGAAPQTAKF
jgi:hypothetical protein